MVVFAAVGGGAAGPQRFADCLRARSAEENVMPVAPGALATSYFALICAAMSLVRAWLLVAVVEVVRFFT